MIERVEHDARKLQTGLFPDHQSLFDAHIDVQVRETAYRAVASGMLVHTKNGGTNGVINRDRVGEHVDSRRPGTFDGASDTDIVRVSPSHNTAMRVVPALIRSGKHALLFVR